MGHTFILRIMFKVLSLVYSVSVAKAATADPVTSCKKDSDCETNSINIKCDNGQCVQCRRHGHCRHESQPYSPEWVCSSNVCYDCTGNGDCRLNPYYAALNPGNAVCKDNKCVECTGSGDCQVFGENAKCDTATNTCFVPCGDDKCYSGDICKEYEEVCVDCLTNADCEVGEICDQDNECTENDNSTNDNSTNDDDNTTSMISSFLMIITAGMFL